MYARNEGSDETVPSDVLGSTSQLYLEGHVAILAQLPTYWYKLTLILKCRPVWECVVIIASCEFKYTLFRSAYKNESEKNDVC